MYQFCLCFASALEQCLAHGRGSELSMEVNCTMKPRLEGGNRQAGEEASTSER